MTATPHTLHVESGVVESHLEGGPSAYAGELARYITNASTIRVRVLEKYGRAPSLENIQRMQRSHADARAKMRVRIEQEEEDEFAEVEAKLREPIARPLPKPASWRLIGSDLVASIARDFGLTLAEIKGPCRRPIYMDARGTVTRIMRKRGISFPKIARMLGRTDHTTAINLDRKFYRYASRNPTVMRSYNRHTR